MNLDERFLALLRCPETGQTLAVASADALARAVNTGVLHDGKNPAAFDTALLREDGRVLYPVRDGIPVMLVEEAVHLPPP